MPRFYEVVLGTLEPELVYARSEVEAICRVRDKHGDWESACVAVDQTQTT